MAERASRLARRPDEDDDDRAARAAAKQTGLATYDAPQVPAVNPGHGDRFDLEADYKRRFADTLTKNTTIRLSPELRQRWRSHSNETGETLQQIVAILLDNYLKSRNK